LNTVGERELIALSGLPEDEREETLDLVRYWRAINRNKWRIAALVGAVTVLAVLYAQSLPPVYRATTTALIERAKSRVPSIEDLYASWVGSEELLSTQAEILRSRELATRLVRKLDLTKHPVYAPAAAPPPWYTRFLPAALVSKAPQPPPAPEALEQSVATAVQGGITVKPMRNSLVLQISFDSVDPGLAAQVPNALVDLFITADMEARVKARERAMAFLSEQSETLRKKVVASEHALQDFREREKIVETKDLSLAGATRQLAELTTLLVDARRKRAEAEAAYDQVRDARKGGKGSIERVPAVLRHPLVQRAKQEEAEAERRVEDASKRYGPEHRRMIAARADLRAAQETLSRQIGTVAESLKNEFEAARANEASIERAVQRAKLDIQGFNRKEFQLAALEREVATNRQLYDLFMQRSKETDVSSELQSAVARVIDPAVVPGAPTGPNRQRIVMIAMLMALMLGMALAVLIERLDNTVKSSHETEAKLEVPTVGIVHKTKVKRDQRIERLFLEDSGTPFAEDIRTLRSGVLLSALDSPQKTVLITSALPEEGKSTIAANLALALSHVKKTLLIDADMRRPQIGPILGARGNTPGLSNLVIGEQAPEKCIFAVKGSNLFVLPSGRVPANPLELLSSHRFVEVLETLKRSFEAIVIDAAPVQMVSDPLVIAQVATIVLFVVKADDTPYPVARQGIKRLRRVNAHILGAVLNQLDAEKADKYYGEYSGYGGRYYRKYGYAKH
jgi:succinoglycan biosynthesis transport protein ExoP